MNNNKQAENEEVLRNGCVLLADRDSGRISYLKIFLSSLVTLWK